MGEPNWANRTIFTGDNLDVMRGMNSESVDLIYLDPPFNSNRNYSAPVGSDGGLALPHGVIGFHNCDGERMANRTTGLDSEWEYAGRC